MYLFDFEGNASANASGTSIVGDFNGLLSSKGQADKKATLGVWEVIYDSATGDMIAKSAMKKVAVKW